MDADRALACLQGIATGDAIGKQTETLAFASVRRWYPQGIRGFEGPIGAVIPRYTGNSKHEWRIGETTDDTERTLAVARSIISTGGVSHLSVGREMLRCTKSVHPGVKSLWEFHQANDPQRTAVAHDGCGAAIRVAPVGIFHTPDRLDELVRSAREASISTHGGSLAIAAAAATAAAVSAAVEGADSRGVHQLAEEAAKCAERQWPDPAGRSLSHALRAVHDALASRSALHAADIAGCCFPDGPLTIVPLALALAGLLQSAEEAILLAANIGGDSDSVASIAGGILAAMYPATVNQQWSEAVESFNYLDLLAVGRELVRLRTNKMA